MDEIDESLRQAGLDYEALFVPALFEPWSRRVIATAEIEPGMRVLDVACGTGVVARKLPDLVGGAGHVAALDAAPGMLAAAQAIEPRVDWTLGVAEKLPFADAAFDCVTCQFGLMFLEPAALAEMVRVLKPGGRLVATVWDTLERNPVYATLVELLRAVLGDAAADALALPFSLGNLEATTAPLAALDLSTVDASTAQESAVFPSVDALVGAELQGWLPLFDIHPSEAEVAALVQAATERLAEHIDTDGTFRFETSAHLLNAVR